MKGTAEREAEGAREESEENAVEVEVVAGERSHREESGGGQGSRHVGAIYSSPGEGLDSGQNSVDMWGGNTN